MPTKHAYIVPGLTNSSAVVHGVTYRGFLLVQDALGQWSALGDDGWSANSLAGAKSQIDWYIDRAETQRSSSQATDQMKKENPND